jgi:hypothetical protein
MDFRASFRKVALGALAVSILLWVASTISNLRQLT